MAVLLFCILKRIQTPHSWFWNFGADKASLIRWSGCRVQVWFQVWALARQCQSSSNHSQRLCYLTNGFDCKVNGQALVAVPEASWTGKRKHRAFPSLQKSLMANMLPLLQCWLSPRVNKVLKICKFLAATRLLDKSLFFPCDCWNGRDSYCLLSSAHCFAPSFNQ